MIKSVPLSMLCVFLCLATTGCGGGGPSSSSGSDPGGGTTTPSGLQFTSPTTPQTIEVGQTNPTIFLKVSQSVNWSLQSGCLHGQPAGTLSNQTTTTATYNGPTQSVSTNCATNPVDVVVATSQTASNQSVTLTIAIVQTPPCIGSSQGGCGLQRISYLGTGNDGCTVGVPCCPPAGTVIPSGAAALGAAYTQALYASFGIPPYSWKVVGGSLPVGLSLLPGSDSTTMTILGTPVTPGCSAVQFEITDSRGVRSTPSGGAPATLYLPIVPAALKIQAPSYPIAYNQTTQSGDPGVPYAPVALTASGGIGTYTWALDTALIPPPNLSFTTWPSNSGAFVLSGTPAPGAELGPPGGTTGQYPTLVQVNDAQQPYPAVGRITLGNMGDAPLTQFCSAAAPLPPTLTNGGDITLNPVNGDAYLQGTFAFLLRGSDANGPVVMAGSVVLDGMGNVVRGVEDITRSSGPQSYTIDPVHSSYSLGVDVSVPIGSGGMINLYNRGCMTLTNSAGTTTTFALTVSGCSNNFSESGVIASFRDACGMTQNNGMNVAAGTFTSGRIIEFDDNTGAGTRATGFLRMQDTSSFSNGLSGRYAFGLAGWDAAKGHYAIAGSLQAGSGNLSGAAADIDDAGVLSSQLTGGSGSYSVGLSGRGTATLAIGQASFNLAFYTVSKTEIILISTDMLGGTHPVIGGEAVLTANAFSGNSLHTPQMIHIGGLATAGPDVSVGLLNFDGVGSFAGTLFENQAGTIATASVSGAYAVDPATGRSLFSAPVQGQNLGPHPFVAYLVPPASSLTRASCSQPANCITGFVVGVDNTAQDGILEFQVPATEPPPPFSNRYIVGDYAYGNDENLSPPSTPTMTANTAGGVFASVSSSSSSSGSLGGSSVAPFFEDVSYGDPNYCLLPGAPPGPQPCLLLLPSQLLSGSYIITTNGTGNFGGQTASVTNGNVTFYIDQSPLSLHPVVMVAEQ